MASSVERLTYLHSMIVELRDMTVGSRERLLEFLLDMAASEAQNLVAGESGRSKSRKKPDEQDRSAA